MCNEFAQMLRFFPSHFYERLRYELVSNCFACFIWCTNSYMGYGYTKVTFSIERRVWYRYRYSRSYKGIYSYSYRDKKITNSPGFHTPLAATGEASSYWVKVGLVVPYLNLHILNHDLSHATRDATRDNVTHSRRGNSKCTKEDFNPHSQTTTK